MAPLFSKRLGCFYCGRRSALSNRGSVRKWRCNHCEAINYLDEVRVLFLAFVLIDLHTDYFLCRKERLRTLLPMRPTLLCMAREPQARPSNRPTSQHPACFARNVFATSICLRQHLHPTFLRPMILVTVPMKGSIRSSAKIWKNGIPRSALNASHT